MELLTIQLQDPSLWCVSSWNDHGQKPFVSDPTRLLRSDFFPGLGWMLRRDTWNSIKGDW
jgi:alpha-1,3-mannosyl-glycoprotein beta-1,2-N-acetylglucosaminyltransferase